MTAKAQLTAWRTTMGLLGVVLVLMASSCATPPAAGPEPRRESPDTISASINPRAERLIRAWSDYVQGLRHIEFDVIDTLDRTTDSGQKIQHSHRHEAALSRPAMLRIQTTGDDIQRTLWKDGKMLTLLDHVHNAYAQIADSGRSMMRWTNC